MAKVLRGSSRQAWAFLLANWRGLAKVSVIPMFIYFAVAWMQLRFMSKMYRSLLTSMEGQHLDPSFAGAYMTGMALNSLAGLLGMLAMGWLFATIIRYRKSGNAPWLMLDKAGAKAAAMTLLYGIGMFLLAMAAYFVGALVLMLPLGLAAAFVDKSSGGAVVAALFAFIGFPALVAFLFWFLFRFLAGLPGVALGHSPDFFRDIWPLARGESWGLPLRMIVFSLITYIPMLAIMLPVMWPTMKAQAEIAQGSSDPAALFSLMADMLDRMPLYMLLMTIVFTPFFWFFTLLLATAFERFYARHRANQTAPAK